MFASVNCAEDHACINTMSHKHKITKSLQKRTENQELKLKIKKRKLNIK